MFSFCLGYAVATLIIKATVVLFRLWYLLFGFTPIEKREKESGPMKTSSYYFRTKKKREKRRERRSEREEIKRRKLSGKMGGIHLAPGVVSSSCAAASSASSSPPVGK